MHMDLHMTHYKIQMVHRLNPQAKQLRMKFAESFLSLAESEEDLVHRLWMTDEAHFHLSAVMLTNKITIFGPERIRKSYIKASSC